MTSFLLFQLHGALASWGEQAVGQMRHTAHYPGHSALVGLVCAALGYRRSQKRKLAAVAACLCFGVKVWHPGYLLADFHTAQVPSAGKITFYTRAQELGRHPAKLHTVLSTREYRTDGYWTVAAWLRDVKTPPVSLEQVAQALRRPVFTLYLGRKSCPPDAPLSPTIVEEETLKKALDGYGRQPLYPAGHTGKSAGKSRESALAQFPQAYYWEQCPFAGMQATQVARRTDYPGDRERWHFGNRDEHCYIPGTSATEE